jgi:hypothetical protein
MESQLSQLARSGEVLLLGCDCGALERHGDSINDIAV